MTLFEAKIQRYSGILTYAVVANNITSALEMSKKLVKKAYADRVLSVSETQTNIYLAR